MSKNIYTDADEILSSKSRQINEKITHFRCDRVHRQIQYWAHMLDESSHTSYYDMYMQENPEDKLPKLIDALIGEFAKSLRKDNIDLNDCVSNGELDFEKVDAMQKKLKSTYTWELIPA